MDWERQRTYDYEDGKEAGITIGLAEGAQQKAMEDALVAIKEFGASPEVAAQKMGAPLDDVLEALNHCAPTN